MKERYIIEFRTRETLAKRNHGQAITSIKINGKKKFSCPYHVNAGEELLDRWAGLHFNGQYKKAMGSARERLRGIGFKLTVLEYKTDRQSIMIER